MWPSLIAVALLDVKPESALEPALILPEPPVVIGGAFPKVEAEPMVQHGG
jgi:hypothetical protein